MTKLEKLIQALCPDGVEYKPLGDIATISRGGSFQKKDYTENGVSCIHYGQIYMHYGLFTEKTLSYISDEVAQKQKFAEPGDIIMAVTSENIDDVCKCMAWLGSEKVAVSGHTAIIHHSINPKYLVYWLSSTMFYQQKVKIAHGTKVIEVAPARLADIILPVPPLPVQREIVRILDNFTEITQKLTTELAAELIARKQQYEYYRNRLLAFDVRGGGTSRTEWRMFGETCFLQAGKAIDAESISKEKTLEYCIPCYGGNGLRGYVRKANQKGEKPLVGRQGALCGNVCFAKGDYYATEHAVVVTDRGFYNSRFLYHLLVNKNLNQYKTAGAQPGLSVTKLETILLPVPETEIQNRIADVLDNFDAICTDLSSGLPAEIEARQKQYEYYRDKLLSFEEKI